MAKGYWSTRKMKRKARQMSFDLDRSDELEELPGEDFIEYLERVKKHKYKSKK